MLREGYKRGQKWAFGQTFMRHDLKDLKPHQKPLCTHFQSFNKTPLWLFRPVLTRLEIKSKNGHNFCIYVPNHWLSGLSTTEQKFDIWGCGEQMDQYECFTFISTYWKRRVLDQRLRAYVRPSFWPDSNACSLIAVVRPDEVGRIYHTEAVFRSIVSECLMRSREKIGVGLFWNGLLGINA